HRVPAGVSVVSPASACPTCESPIRARDNVPVLSWLVLRGRCRDCSAPISARYPLVELGTAVLVALAALVAAPSLMSATSIPETIAASAWFLALAWFAAAGIALAAIDLDTHRLPNAIVYPTILMSLGTALIAAGVTLDPGLAVRALGGALALSAGYLALTLAWKGGMGLGDVKLAVAIGALLGWVGWGALAIGAFAAFLVGGVVAIALMIARRVERRGGIPFGPWMIVGAWIGIIAGPSLFDGYLNLVGLA
ncbi:MAG: prepilin peptidase, partial [Microcella sp.]